MKTIKSICFVCLGNIVRSPLAENLFRHLAQKRGLMHRYEVSSAGTSDYHLGEPPDYRMRLVAMQHGLDYNGRARQIKQRDLQYYDLILAMDKENYADLLAMATPQQREKICLLRTFDSQAKHELDVPDPYNGGQDGFEEVYRIIERSVIGLLNALEHGYAIIASD